MRDRRLRGVAALVAASLTPLRKLPAEKDTEFVKRIVNAYLDAEADENARLAGSVVSQARGDK